MMATETHSNPSGSRKVQIVGSTETGFRATALVNCNCADPDGQNAGGDVVAYEFFKTIGGARRFAMKMVAA